MPYVGEKEYDDALREFRTASAIFRQACTAYRLRNFNDAQFLRARADFHAAQTAMDRAETDFINANQS